MNLADAYYELEKYDKAVSYYKAAMENKDIYWTAYYKLARCYVYQSKWDTAQTSYETLLKRDPKNNSLKSSLAYIYAMNGNVEKSTVMYKELIESNPDQSEYLENYICLLLAQDKKDEAKTQFDILAEKYPASKKIEELSKQFEAPPEEEPEPALEESVN
ncbi:MAG: tetratricopeptide repeat protein [Treponema sp.]|nr:tetratricopeptide repeat protein [Treponema sp.]